MKIPQTPPSLPAVLQSIESGSQEQILQTINKLYNADVGPCDAQGRYLHWDKIRYLVPPEGYDSELYWLAIKNARRTISKPLPFYDMQGNAFTYAMPDAVMRDILWMSENATGAIAADTKVSDPREKQTYLINSLIEEAINSSQLEGASTTRHVAKEMLRTNRQPKNNSEKMIRNNYYAMAFVRENKAEPLTPAIIFELHKLLTEGTLRAEDQHKAGVFREACDDIGVYSHDDVLVHTPPQAAELADRLQAVCDFANQAPDDAAYIPPIVKAIIVHFMLGYDHPFVDGNGRIARALFYWVMAKEGYWLMEYISISRVLKSAPAQYAYAYLHTETDDSDATYFIVHQLNTIKTAIKDLHGYLAKKSAQLRDTESVLANSSLQGLLNHRQLRVLKNALKNPGAEYTIRSHQTSHGVAYQTSRTDLLDLSDKYGILKKYKVGKKDIFIAPPNLWELIKSMSS